jgi:anti-sigma factor RsiW
MDCSLMSTELMGYHFAVTDDDEREAIEAHLLDCRDCLRSYLAVKRSIECGTGLEARPSHEARKRLRDEVAKTFGPPSALRLPWMGRPIPLYQGLVAAGLAAAFAAVVVPRLAAVVPSRPSGDAATVDTSRTLPESVTIF